MPRTTLTLDPDVATALEQRRREHGTTLKEEVNTLLRTGLSRAVEPVETGEPFRTKPLPLGKPRLESLDDVAEVLAFAEGEDYR